MTLTHPTSLPSPSGGKEDETTSGPFSFYLLHQDDQVSALTLVRGRASQGRQNRRVFSVLRKRRKERVREEMGEVNCGFGRLYRSGERDAHG